MQGRGRAALAAGVTAAILAGTTSPALAAPENPRACFGEFASTFAQTVPQSGREVSALASAGGSDFGENVAGFAHCPGA
jgi:hypothetical protein